MEEGYTNIDQRTPCSDISIDSEGKVVYFQTVTFRFDTDFIVFKTGSEKGYEFFKEVEINDLAAQINSIVFDKKLSHYNVADASFNVIDGKIVEEVDPGYTVGHDHIDLGLDVGLGTVKDFFAPDIGLSLTIHKMKKGKQWLHAGFAYEAPFFFETNEDGEDVINVDGFTYIFFGGENFGGKFGVMVNDNSSAFKNETYRISFYRDWKVRLESGIYISDYAREIYPFIRLSKTW